MSDAAIGQSFAQSASGLSAEEELAGLKARQTLHKLIEDRTRSGWDSIKVNFRFGLALSLLFTVFSLFLVNDVNINKVEYANVLFCVFTFGTIAYNIDQIKNKVRFSIYLDDDARMSDSPTAEAFKDVWSRDKILDQIREQDRTNVVTLASASILGAGLALASLFALAERTAAIRRIGFSNLTAFDYFGLVSGSLLFFLTLWACLYVSVRSGIDLKKLAKTLRVYK